MQLKMSRTSQNTLEDNETAALLRRRLGSNEMSGQTRLSGDNGQPTNPERWKFQNVANAAVLLLATAGFVYAIFLASVLIMESGEDFYYEGRGNDGFHSLFLTLLEPMSARGHLFNLTKEPHLAGTPENNETALYVAAKFKEYGLKTFTSTYPVLLSYPGKHKVTMTVQNIKYDLRLKEAAVAGDAYTLNNAKVTGPFHGYSPSGKVEAEVVYANYGQTEDFEELQARGVDMKGAIVICRYGKIYRGDKVANAARFGAVGVLIYSDPEDYAANCTEGVYPDARWLPATGFQRGSTYVWPGDPLTPGWPSCDDCEALPHDSPELGLPPLPSLPLSYSDAQPILTYLGGPLAPASWSGGLNMTAHHLGRGPVKIRMDVQMRNEVRTIVNVFGVIDGAEESDRYVIMGNHRDAWVYGAVDPNSGTAALLEAGRGLGILLARGWRPRRTMVLASWDAEEYALIGSTEWAESSAPLLSSRAVAYLNVDSAVSGPGWNAGCTPQLDALIRECAKATRDPDAPSRTLYDGWVAQESSGNRWNATRAPPRLFRLGGSGTDFAAFVEHLGIPGADMFFGGDYPMYHSVYDDFDWMERFGDPGFRRHVAIAGVWGLVALRLADDPVIPFYYPAYGKELEDSLEQLELRIASVGGELFLDMSPVKRAIQSFVAAAEVINAEVNVLKTSDTPKGVGEEAWMARRRRSLNDRLMEAERSFTDPEGLAGRSWYRHLIYGPVRDNGYGSLAMPGVFDAIADTLRLPLSEQTKGWRDVQHEVYRVARAITRSSMSLNGSLFN